MAFQYEEGTASDVADWFTKLEAFMIAAGWTVEDGSGTQTVVFKSIGEAGGRTKLYVRFRQDGVTLQYVWSRVQDDLGATHSTTEDTFGGRLDAGGGGVAEFDYWMLADRDVIAVCFLTGTTYSSLYAGIVERMAVTVPDETYEMVSVAIYNATHSLISLQTGRMLQKHDGTWDDKLSAVSFTAKHIKNPLDLSFMLPGVYVSEYHITSVNDQHLGQLKHVSRLAEVAGLNPGDTITTGFGGASSWWTVLGTYTNQWAFHAGGTLPTGAWEGGFSYTSGAATDVNDLNTKFKAFLTTKGWSEVANPSPAWPIDYYLNSSGQLGADDIWLRWRYDTAQGYWGGYAMDDASDSHNTGYIAIGFVAGDFPLNYFIAGDGDCFVHGFEKSGVWYWGWWGMFTMYMGDPASIATVYKSGILSSSTRRIVRGMDGGWSRTLSLFANERYWHSSPNLVDGTTYIIYPLPIFQGSWIPHGQPKYVHRLSSTAIAVNDTVTIGSRKYKYITTDYAVRIQ